MTSRRRRTVVVAATAVYAVGSAVVVVSSTAMARALLVAHVLVLASVVAIRRLSRGDAPDIRRLMFLALGAKLVASAVRYFVAFDVYGGKADSSRYHEAGVVVARSFRDGDFSPDSPLPLVGTRFVELAAGALYTVVGPTMVGAYVTFACLGFWGSYLFYRAVTRALPDDHHRRYAVLVFLFPSVLFWPSSLGKDAWMLFALGLTTYGVARFFTKASRGVAPLAAGLGACALVRPHIALAIAASLGASALLTRAPRVRGVSGGRLAAFAIAAVAVALVVGQVQDYFDLDEIDAVSIEQLLDQAQSQTDEGGSSFEATRARSLPQIPAAVLSVLFRPLPTEARNPFTALAALEGVVLMFLFVRWRSSLLAALARSLSERFVAFLLVYTIVFCVAFSSFGNFGILSRQRAQLFPFVFMMLALRRRPLQQLQVAEAEVEMASSGRGRIGESAP